jgi:hypothetical protein
MLEISSRSRQNRGRQATLTDNAPSLLTQLRVEHRPDQIEPPPLGRRRAYRETALQIDGEDMDIGHMLLVPRHLVVIRPHSMPLEGNIATIG